MKIDLERGTGHFIRGYSGGEVLIGAEAFRAPLVVTVERIIADWSPPPVGALTLADFGRVLELEPEVILLGTGASQVFPPAALTSAILTRGVGFDVMNTSAACRTYNVLASEYRRVAAALYVI
jgi:uncharacterized protein